MMTSSELILGMRERKKAQTRAALLESAEAQFAARGIDKVPLEEVAAAADVSTPTLYNYFPSKADLAFNLVYRNIEDELALAEVRHKAVTSLAGLLDQVGESLCHLLASHPRDVLRHALGSTANAQLGERYEAQNQAVIASLATALERLRSQGALSLVVDCSILARLIHNLIEAESMAYVRSNDGTIETVRAALERQFSIIAAVGTA